MTFDPPGVKNEEQETGQENKEIESKNFDEKDERTIEKSKRWFVDCSVFKKKMFVVLTLCTTLANLGHNTPRFHMVRFSEELHVSADAASRLFIIIGICTFIGRLLSGLICNMRHINPVYVYFIGLILDGSDVVFLSQAKTYGHLIAFSFLYGLADGLLVGTFYIAILNSVEVTQKASAFGLSALCYGTTVATGPALAGFMTDHLHSYIPSFILAAVAEFVAATLLLILICDKKKTENFHAVECGEAGKYEHKGRTVWETGL